MGKLLRLKQQTTNKSQEVPETEKIYKTTQQGYRSGEALRGEETIQPIPLTAHCVGILQGGSAPGSFPMLGQTFWGWSFLSAICAPVRNSD